jgi:formate dehydrogenase subunit delta
MTSEKLAKLVLMANQVGAFYAAIPENESTEGTTSHLRAYWTPKMIDELVAFVDEGGGGLNPTAARAIAALSRSRRS